MVEEGSFFHIYDGAIFVIINTSPPELRNSPTIFMRHILVILFSVIILPAGAQQLDSLLSKLNEQEGIIDSANARLHLDIGFTVLLSESI